MDQEQQKNISATTTCAPLYSVATDRRIISFKGKARPLKLRDCSGPALDATYLLDSGASHTFVDRQTIKQAGYVSRKSSEPLTVKLADGSRYVADEVVNLQLRIGATYTKSWTAYLLPVDGYTIILGYNWLEYHNPRVDWKNTIVRLRLD